MNSYIYENINNIEKVINETIAKTNIVFAESRLLQKNLIENNDASN